MAPEITAYDQSGYEVRRIILLVNFVRMMLQKTGSRRIPYAIRSKRTEFTGYIPRLITMPMDFLLFRPWKIFFHNRIPMLESKTVSTDIYGQLSVQWTEYAAPTRRIQFNRIPTSDIVAKSFVVDGFTINQNDHAGLHSSQERFFTSSGITMRRTDCTRQCLLSQSPT